MRRIKLAFAFAGILAVTAACAVGGDPVPATVLAVDCATFEERAADDLPVLEAVRIGVGDGLEVHLCANPSTGFSWEEPTWEGAEALELVTRGTAAPVDAAPGAPAQETFTFRAVTSGVTTVHFVYSQPWAGGIKGAWRLDLAVTVD